MVCWIQGFIPVPRPFRHSHPYPALLGARDSTRYVLQTQFSSLYSRYRIFGILQFVRGTRSVPIDPASLWLIASSTFLPLLYIPYLNQTRFNSYVQLYIIVTKYFIDRTLDRTFHCTGTA